MKFVLSVRADGLLEAVDDQTIENLSLMSVGSIFSTEGMKELNRSQLQNAYLWGFLYKHIARLLDEGGIVIRCDDGGEIAYTAEKLHEPYFAEVFRRTGDYTVKGRRFSEYESTAKMSKKRFTQYVDQIKQFCIQHWGIHVPETDKYGELF